MLAVGNPFGLGGTVTAGIVSARGRDIGASAYDDFIQIDAPVNKGNSGGPTFDTDGNVIGVNTAIFSPSGGSVGIAFAIPADTVKSVDRAAQGPWLGHARLDRRADPTGDRRHRRQSRPQEGGRRAGRRTASTTARRPKAGIEAGDVITAVDGEAGQGCARSRQEDRRDGAEDLGQALGPAQGREKTLDIDARRIAEQQGSRCRSRAQHDDVNADLAKLGLTLAPAGRVAGAGSEGVVVTGVNSSGVAADHGFSTGDVILEVAGKTVSSPADVRKVIASARKEGKRTVLMRVKSGDNTRFVALPVGNG